MVVVKMWVWKICLPTWPCDGQVWVLGPSNVLGNAVEDECDQWLTCPATATDVLESVLIYQTFAHSQLLSRQEQIDCLFPMKHWGLLPYSLWMCPPHPTHPPPLTRLYMTKTWISVWSQTDSPCSPRQGNNARLHVCVYSYDFHLQVSVCGSDVSTSLGFSLHSEAESVATWHLRPASLNYKITRKQMSRIEDWEVNNYNSLF